MQGGKGVVAGVRRWGVMQEWAGGFRNEANG